EKQNWSHRSLGPQRAAHLEAIAARQHHIEHDQVAARALEPLHRSIAVVHGVDIEAFRAQVLREPRRDERIILDDEDTIDTRAHVTPAAGHETRNSAPQPAPLLYAATRPPASCIKRFTM